MSDPTIYTIPEAYWGGRAPRPSLPQAKLGGNISAVRKKIAPRTIFLIVVAGLFLAVVSGAAWYYTRGLRAPTPSLSPSLGGVDKVGVPSLPPPAPVEPALPAPPPIPAEPTAPTLPAPPTPSQDPDHDQLSEAEEVLYNTNSTLPDTDNDGFLDGHEVFNLYNPSGTAPEKLEPAGLAQKYTSPSLGFEILYPRSWVVNPEAGERGVVFQAGDGEAIKLLIVENLEKLELGAWLAQHYPEISVSSWNSNKVSLTGFVAPDGRTIYLASGTNIFALSYTPSVEPPRYLRTLEMMANSLVVRE